LNFTQVTTSFDIGTFKPSQFLQNKSPPHNSTSQNLFRPENVNKNFAIMRESVKD